MFYKRDSYVVYFGMQSNELSRIDKGINLGGNNLYINFKIL